MSFEELSPLKRFKLVVTSCPNGGFRVIITRVSDHKEIFSNVRHCYAMHHLWFVKDGDEYLLTGSTNNTQLIVNLDNESKFESVKSEFCWSNSYLSNDGKTLAVCGCFWACPYEYKFFDFSNPEQGWPELKLQGEDTIYYRGEKLPEWDIENHFVVYDSFEEIKVQDRFLKYGSQEYMDYIMSNVDIPDEDFIDVVTRTRYFKRIGDEVVLIKTVCPEIL